MTKATLLYLLTGTETPLHITKRENEIIDKCLVLINEREGEEKQEFHKGDKVWWTDPDEDISTGEYTVVEVNSGGLVLTNKAGSEIGAYTHECKKL